MLTPTQIKVFTVCLRRQPLEVVVAGARSPINTVVASVLLAVLLTITGSAVEQGVAKPWTS
jgi:hypothetical protein